MDGARQHIGYRWQDMGCRVASGDLPVCKLWIGAWEVMGCGNRSIAIYTLLHPVRFLCFWWMRAGMVMRSDLFLENYRSPVWAPDGMSGFSRFFSSGGNKVLGRSKLKVPARETRPQSKDLLVARRVRSHSQAAPSLPDRGGRAAVVHERLALHLNP